MHNKKESYTPLWITLGVIVVALLAYWFYATGGKTTEPELQNLTVTAQDNFRGNPQAKVTLVEYADFQCPSCGAYYPLLKALERDYSNDVKFVFRNFPLTQIHKNALTAANFAQAATMQGKFFEFHDVLYEKQNEWAESLDAREKFKVYAMDLGLNPSKLEQDAATEVVTEKVLADYKDGVKRGVQGTPTFFLNGVKIDRNPGSIEEFKKLLDNEIAKTKTATSTN